MLSEGELIRKCIQGNRTAQKQLYEQYSSLFFAVCLRYMPVREEAEDVLVMGFTLIFQKMDTYKNEGNFEGWMRKIIINTAITTLRANKKHYEMRVNEEERLIKRKNAMSENTIESHITAKEILSQIEQMSIGYRTIINLYCIEGYSYEEIAQLLNINIGTVRSQLSRARKILQKKLEDFK
jgi:RNA polymerase sigma-70 factor (ECF subfamily)